MKKSIFKIGILFLMAALMISCSGGKSDPIIPSDKNPTDTWDNVPYIEEQDYTVNSDAEIATIGDTFHARGIFGEYELTLNQDTLTGEISSIRKASIGESYLVSAASFFTVTPCLDCLRLESVELTNDHLIRAVFMIDHPFEKGDRDLPPSGKNRLDLDLFDLALVIVPYSATMRTFDYLDVQVYPRVVVGADGYTRELANVTFNPHVYPYYLVVDDTTGDELTYNRFEMGTKDVPLEAFFNGGGLFRLYLTAGYGASATLASRLSPEYYNPEYNRKEAWKVEVIPPQGDDPPSPGNTWNSLDATTEHSITVKVWDWQQTATVSPNYPDFENRDHIYKESRIDRVSAEIRGMTNRINWVKHSESGDGSIENPLTYKIPMANEKLLSDGEYIGLVKVTDERVPTQQGDIGTVDSLVHSFNGKDLFWYWIPEFATYQIFTATIVSINTIRVTSPNGGETWTIGTSRNVSWTSSGSIANVNIDLSIDGGANYTIPIANNIPNTGIFNIPSVGNWPTTEARIRVSDAMDATINDESDANFTIQEEPSLITVISPNGGEVWAKGTQQEIRWDADASIQYVRIQLSIDSGATYTMNITGSTLNDGSHMWNVPIEAVGTNNRIKVSHLTNASIFDESDADFEITCLLPNPPQTVNVTNGTYPDKVVVTWSNVSGADDYNIYRDGGLLESDYSGLSWEDTTAVPGVIYYYQISTNDTCGEGAKGPSDPGVPGSACILPEAPTNLSATDGTQIDSIVLTWDTVPNATGYSIYRDFSATPVVSGIPGPPWSDYSVGLCQTYDYEVAADSTCGESDRSLSDSGYAEVFPEVPTNVDASDGDYYDRVEITWDSPDYASTYNIYRDTLLLDGDIGYVNLYEDFTATPGIPYEYQIEGENDCGVGPVSAPVIGSRCVLPEDPANVHATDGDFSDRVRLTWDAVAGATGYDIYRGGSLEVDNFAGTSWDDLTVTPGDTYFYQIEALNDCGSSNRMPADPGESGYACVPPDAPTGLIATDGDFNDRVRLDWDSEPTATSYNIYRDNAFLINVVGITHDDMTVTPGIVYEYEVEAVNACGPSPDRSDPDDGYAYACIADTNTTCGESHRMFMVDSTSGCVDQIVEAWFDIYVTPNGITSASTIDLSIPAGTVDIYVYGLNPGGGGCPGDLIASLTNTGTTSMSLPDDSSSRIYIQLVGNSGEVMYTMDTNIVAALSTIPIQICVATDDGTPGGNWPYHSGSSTYLNLTILNNMINWSNSFWNQFGYNLEWDGSTVTIMDSQFYNLSNANLMHSTYHTNNLSTLYFVNQLDFGNTAYCRVYSNKSQHNVNNVFTVYSPNVWNWQAVVAHEYGHGFGYYYDQYLFDVYGCDCGDIVCLDGTPAYNLLYLFWVDDGCYNGNLMWYDVGWTWDQYDITDEQVEAVHQFHFEYPSNFPWY